MLTPATPELEVRSTRSKWRRALLLCVALPLTAAAQPSDGDTKTVQARRTTTPPVIDGRLDDAVWAEAAIVDDFHQVKPTEFAAPSERTIVYLLYDDDNLYVGARMFDKEPDKINARIQRQGQPIGGDDRFYVHIDPFHNHRSGYLFGVNANGVRFDGVFQNITDRLFDWDGIHRAEGAVDEQGWTAELAIPFKTLSFDPASDTWGINFVRNIIRRDEEIAWVSRNRNTNPTTMGTVTALHDLKQGAGLDIVPSIAVRASKTYATGIEDTNSEPSLDVFYKLTSALNAALTINTDFSATEVDNRQVNLTRFNLFFPERRDFFLQDLDIFQFASIGRLNTGNNELVNTATTRASRENGRPFFSRRLGISSTGEEVPLEYGGKLSGRVGRWDIGALSVRQDQFPEESPTVDATTAFVGRVVANVLAESSVGFIATSGDPTSNFDNTLVGADFRYVNNRLAGGRSLEAEAWYQQSDSADLQGDDSAAGVGVRMPNNTGLRGGLALRRLEANFNPALGFISRTGIDDYTAEFGHTWRPRGRKMQSVFSGFDGERIEYLDDGSVQSQVLSFRALEMDNRSRDDLWVRFFKSQEGLRKDFEISPGVVIPADDYAFDEFEVHVGSGNQRKFWGAFEYRNGDFYDGQRLALTGSISWRPGRHFRTSIDYEYDDVELPYGDFVVRLTRLTLETAFSSTLSWVNLIQYDNISNSAGINSRLHWVPQAGREGFVVLNHNLQNDPTDDSFRSSYADVTVKFGYTFRY